MRRFTQLEAVAAAIPEANIDTDKILAGRFLKTVKRDGLGQFLFHSMRFDENGKERTDFVLNRSPWRSAEILIALDNFGCGSSREHAPWALADFGIRTIIAPSFADIFRNNCYKNGILPIELGLRYILLLITVTSSADTSILKIDLPKQTVETSNYDIFHFSISPASKEQLLLGLDEISESERLLGEVSEFEASIKYACPSIPHEFSFKPFSFDHATR